MFMPGSLILTRALIVLIIADISLVAPSRKKEPIEYRTIELYDFHGDDDGSGSLQAMQF